MNRAWGLGAALALSLGCADRSSEHAGPTADPCAAFDGRVVEASSGPVRGHRSGDSCAFLGIPYAGTTSGEQRFRAPVPPSTRSAVTDADRFGPPCPQFGADEELVGTETCLTLNVWTPGGAPELQPVLVFLHGGGNVAGSSADQDHDGRDLAVRGGLIVVSLNFRLGALGYLAHGALSREHFAESSGNYGLLDQLAGLEWVHRNVGAFGGDPSRVLLVGQSAGARNACALVASPLARGLFSRVALHSGACNLRSLAEQQRIGEEIARLTGCANAPDIASCLRRLEPESVMHALPGIPGPMVASEHNPNVDGWLLDRAPLEIIAAGEHSRVPLIVSTNQDEVGGVIAPELTDQQYPVLARALFGADFIPEMLERYPLEDFATPRDALVRMISDARYACPARKTARAALAGGSPVFRSVWGRELDHGLELLFLFKSFERHGRAPTPSQLELSDRMIRHYARFAATGDPGAEEESWPLYDPESDRHLYWSDGASERDGISPHCDFWDAF
jgi:para-nitrobenzyl esterase